MTPTPTHEKERISALRSLNILDTPPDSLYDRIVQTAQSIFDVPIVLVSLVDEHRQWFKSKVGLEANETPREVSFCAHAICESVFDELESRLFEVRDATADSRFADNALVVGEPWIRYYLGFILQYNQQNLGTLCLIDTQTRSFSDKQLKIFGNLGFIVEELLSRKSASDLTFDQNYRQINEVKEKLKEVGVSFNEWRILNTVVKLHLATPAIICDQLGLSKPLVSNYLRELESKDLISRDRKYKRDRRLTLLSCTPKGLNFWKQGKEIFEETIR